MWRLAAVYVLLWCVVLWWVLLGCVLLWCDVVLCYAVLYGRRNLTKNPSLKLSGMNMCCDAKTVVYEGSQQKPYQNPAQLKHLKPKPHAPTTKASNSKPQMLQPRTPHPQQDTACVTPGGASASSTTREAQAFAPFKERQSSARDRHACVLLDRLCRLEAG